MNRIFAILTIVVAFPWAGFSTAHAELNVDSNSMYQISFINPVQMINENKSIYGARLNFVYGVNYDVVGLDIGLVNRTKNFQKGLQVGFFNSNIKMSGLQVGLVNYTNFLYGVQIGLLNYNTQGMTDFFPIVNWAF